MTRDLFIFSVARGTARATKEQPWWFLLLKTHEATNELVLQTYPDDTNQTLGISKKFNLVSAVETSMYHLKPMHFNVN